MDNVKFFKNMIKPLMGAKIVGVTDDGQGFFGLIVEKAEKQTILWALSDQEGNSPGWLESQEKS